MAIIVPPARLPLRGLKWRCDFPAQRNRSGWTGTSKLVGLPGAQLWTATGTFVTIIGQDRAKPWRAFFLGLRGQQNAFRLVAVEQAQTEIANPRIAGGAAYSATSVIVEGLPSSTPVLVAGDMMTIRLAGGHERLVGLQQPLVSDANGRATAIFEPEIGEPPIANSAVEIQRPWALVSQTSEPAGWDVDVGQTYSFQLAVEEAR